MTSPLALAGAPVALCVRCDHPYPCPDHPGAFYYEDEPAASGTEYDAARERWRLEGRGPWARPGATPRPQEEARPLTELLAMLESGIGLDLALEHRLADAYDRDALKVTRLCASVLRSVAAGRLDNPTGLLWKRLGEVL